MFKMICNNKLINKIIKSDIKQHITNIQIVHVNNTVST